MNLLRPAIQERFRAFLDGGPGGEDIVDEEDLPALHGLRDFYPEGAPHVLLPFGGGQLGLGLGLPQPAEGGEVQRDRLPPADLAGQEKGLVETPLPKAAGVEGDGNYEVNGRRGEFRARALSQKGSQRSGQMGGPAEFETGDGFPDLSLVGAHGARLSETPFPLQAVGAEMVRVGGRGKTDSATGTEGGGKKSDLGEAGGAGAFPGRRVEGASAQRAFGRQKKIQQGPPEGGRTHVRAGK